VKFKAALDAHIKSNFVDIEKVIRRADSRSPWTQQDNLDEDLSARQVWEYEEIGGKVVSEEASTKSLLKSIANSSIKRKTIQDEVRSQLANTPVVPNSSSLLNAPPSITPTKPKAKVSARLKSRHSFAITDGIKYIFCHCETKCLPSNAHA